MHSVYFFLLLFFAQNNSYAQEAHQPCTQMACHSGLTINFPENYTWAPGKYEFHFLLEGKNILCRGKLPLKNCDTSSMSCSDQSVLVTESGCALPRENHGWGPIQIAKNPADISLKIMRNGKVILEMQEKPSYKSLQPNGKNCQPTCTQATIQAKLKSSLKL